jgi:hypothetical protein
VRSAVHGRHERQHVDHFRADPERRHDHHGLFARALSPGLTSTYTVEVLSLNALNVTTVRLACVVDATNTGNTCSDSTIASVPGDVYLQVRVTADSKAAPNTKWRAIFLY